MSFRRGRMSAIHPVKSYKHVVDTNGLITNVVSVTDLVIAKDNPVLADINGVETAATVHGVFLKVDVSTQTPFGGVPRVYMIVFKNPGINLIVPNPATVGSDANKKFVIHQEMTMLSNSPPLDPSIFPRTMFKGVIRVPRNYKRFGQNDRLQLALITPDSTGKADFCVQCIYKEFR